MNTLTFGLSVALIGMLVVFAGLVILIGCIKLISLASEDHKAKKPSAAPAPQPVAEIAAESVIAADEDVTYTLAPETLAAITGALMTMLGDSTGFVVRHVRRVHNAPAWNNAGREDQAYSRM